MTTKRQVRLSTSETWSRLSILLNVFLIACLAVAHRNSKSSNEFNLRSVHDASLVGKQMIFHGGYPSQDRSGQCWCSADKYCMCTPSLAIDLIIASGPDHVWLVRRKDTQQLLAVMGGFVQVGETAESAVARELMEEMGVDLKEIQPHLFGVYSDPRRDNRRSTTSVVFAVHLDANHPLQPRAADDVKDVQRIALEDLDQYAFFSDHKTILMDYKRSVDKRTTTRARQDYGDFATDIVRSTCSSQ